MTPRRRITEDPVERHVPGITEHTVVGLRGELFEPESETAALDRALTLLREIRRRERGIGTPGLLGAIGELEILRDQVAQGYHRNPGRLVIFNPPDRIDSCQSRRVYEVRYLNADDGLDYKHECADGVELYCIVRNGHRELLLSQRQGKPLWGDL